MGILISIVYINEGGAAKVDMRRKFTRCIENLTHFKKCDTKIFLNTTVLIEELNASTC